jgi:phosphotransferase system enzyme I (PtsI)
MASTKSWPPGSIRFQDPRELGELMTRSSRRLLGIGAAPGRVVGVARRVSWDLPPAEHRTISADEIEPEIERFNEARAWARERVEELRESTAAELGDIEAKIFDPQILMLEDPDLIDGTVTYIRENYLSAERAFDWRLLEIRTQIVDAAHLMIVDRLADIQDVRYRVLARLQGRGSDPLALPDEQAILVFQDLTPSVAVRLDTDLVLGLITAAGSRTSHSAVLARSMGIPAVVGVGSSLTDLDDGALVLLDGGSGSIIVNPTGDEVGAHRRMIDQLSEWTERTPELAGPVESVDGTRIRLRANLDQPDDVEAAHRVGAEGVGLFRSEFLVIGRRVIPNEEEQYEAYRRVAQAFPNDPVTLRTFDIGGDKFPLFLEMPPEENPYLGWRAIRVCLDLPDLFRNQLRAAVRARAHGELRILLPFVTSAEEIRLTRVILDEVMQSLPDPGAASRIQLGVMVETPAIVETIDLISDLIDFVSLGTNDLTQYALAVDRGNARLAHLADPLHPAMIRFYARVRNEAAKFGLDIDVCGDLPSDPIGLALLLGLGYRDFSLPVSCIPESREVVRSISCAELARICDSLDAEGVVGLKDRLAEYLATTVPFDTAPVAPGART